MKKVFIALMALVLNMSMFSCSVDSADANDALYETQATEGDEGEDIPLPEPPPIPNTGN
ncbi:MAG: hypothetical protein ABJD66_07480 [Cellulophaga sp.]|uniref:hypothetical protein n=1 Tax=unclassified Cellulophaga TaxID=2634405 RepID=UPI000CAD0E61|nr:MULTISPECIES: hypothetical protein [unclassified Cellulophaga]MDO6491327.1 hypothetical protein [Cellulophaga sp. 2_MG-2023]MDO6495140.1 hypothetical protein [Cellulophaga sp. 3_MG-2023]PKB42712.1 hypothetical protein AX016_0883 [Cellulophaga sp. RHA19]